MTPPDYKNYSLAELQDTLKNIDANRWPERVIAIRKLIDEFPDKVTPKKIAEKKPKPSGLIILIIGLGISLSVYTGKLGLSKNGSGFEVTFVESPIIFSVCLISFCFLFIFLLRLRIKD
jgi:hypothetical protein